MNRRELLTRSGAGLAIASLGGCLGRYRDAVGGVEETTGETTEEGTTADRGSTTDQRPTLSDASFEILQNNCGEPTNEASVEFRDGTVVVTGTISGSNTCYTAKLADATYDPESGALDLTVASMQKEGSDVCAQCIVEIGYETTAAFEGGLPETVNVVHEAMGETKTVATATTGETTTAATSDPN